MKRSLALLAWFAVTLPARAHFIWLAPHDGGKLRMVFSEDPTPDANVPITKISQTKVQVRLGAKPVEVKMTAADDHYLVALPNAGPAEVGAVCEYGILAKTGDAFLLCYYAKTLVGQPSALGMGHPLEILPVAGKARLFEVRWQSKPAAGVEVVIEAPGKDSQKLKTNAQGRVSLAAAPTTGLIAIRAKYVEARSGERDGKAFKEVRHYATLTVAGQ